MYIETQGMVLRQTKLTNGRRIALLFTKKYGKISAGTSISERGKGKSALAMRPFTFGRYELYKKNDYFNINGAETIESFYGIGENVDKYMGASYVLELVDKILDEGFPSPKIFNLTIDFFRHMEKREKKQETLILAYEIQLLKELGTLPVLYQCSCCSSKENLNFFSIEDGGVLCNSCLNGKEKPEDNPLIYQLDFGILDILRYFSSHRLEDFEKIALDDEKSREIRRLLTGFERKHLDLVTMKSEEFLWDKN